MLRFLNRARSLADRALMVESPMRMTPELAASRPPRICKSVVFPAPETPTNEIISPLLIKKEASLITSKFPKSSVKVLVRCSTETIFSAMAETFFIV